MRFWFLVLVLVSLKAFAEKKQKLSPFQVNIDQCVQSAFAVAKIDSNKKLYSALVENFALLGSETTFREALYKEAGELKKLKYEDQVARIYSVADDESIKLISTEELGYKPATTGARYKISTPEARLNELLIHAEFKSDFVKTREYRSKQVLLNLAWSDGQIKNLSAELPGGKKLECSRKATADICTCTH